MSGAELVGSGITIASIVGGLGTADTATPANNGVVAACVGCVLSFATGSLTASSSTQWFFDSGGTIQLVGEVAAAGISAGTTLFSGTWSSASVTQIGDSFNIAGGIFSSSTDATLAAFFGLPDGGLQWTGALNLSLLAAGSPPDAFASSALGSGDETYELNGARREFVEPRDCRHRGVAGGEHRVDQDHVTLCEIVGQL